MQVLVPDSNDLTLSSDFDSGNLQNVERSEGQTLSDNTKNASENTKSKIDISASSSSTLAADQSNFLLWTKSDGPLENPNKNRTWFHYSVTLDANNPEQIVTFNLASINRVQKLFAMGMRPVFRRSGSEKWKRVSLPPRTNLKDQHLQLVFDFTFPATTDTPATYFFAFCTPYSYATLQKNLESLDKRYGPGPIDTQSRIPRPTRQRDIYFHRDILIQSVAKHNIDILTLSSRNELLSSSHTPLPSHLFPLSGRRARNFSMQTKRYFLLSARIHPGETISSYMLDGLLSFLLSTDPRALALRDAFVFIIIPMLNPDGVVAGNYRGDLEGTNLNRVYDAPDRLAHPSVWALVQYATYLRTLGPIAWYIDFHGHASKPGAFLFGNWRHDVCEQRRQWLFARNCYLTNPLFDVGECDFAPKSQVPSTTPPVEPTRPEQSKLGTGRVVMGELTTSPNCYTFEANYYGSKLDRRPATGRADLGDGSSPLLIRSSVVSSAGGGGGDRRFRLADQYMMGRSIGQAVFATEFPDRMGGGRGEEDPWVGERMRRMYSKAGVAIPADAKL